jgi:hypothetical protein
MLDGVLLKVDEVLFIGVLRRFITGRGDKLLRTPGGVLLGSCACHLFFNWGGGMDKVGKDSRRGLVG